jgi:hypothetical protein
MFPHLSPTQGYIQRVKRALFQCLFGSVTKFSLFKKLSLNTGDTLLIIHLLSLYTVLSVTKFSVLVTGK